MPVLQVENLVKKFGDFTAVAGLSLHIEPGECLALLGPNGAGKTTTVEMLEGLQDPTSGKIEILNKSLNGSGSVRREILESVGVLLQETYMYKKLTVIETLDLFGSFYSNPRPSHEIIELMQLEEKADARLESLSGGQKQRVYIGCALINSPTLVFLDEPTTGLDPQARRMIWDLLRTYKGEDKSILLTTHYMEEAEALANRVAIVDKGKIIAEGPPIRLIKDTCGEQIVWFALEDSTNLEKLTTVVPEIRQAAKYAGGYEIATSAAPELITRLTKAADTNLVKINNLQMRRSTLEDVFIKLTGRSIRDD